MSAHTIFDNAPIGSLIAWSDGTPQPPARFNKKLAAWRISDSRGRLIRKQGTRGVGNISLSASFTLHEADYGAGVVVAIRVHRTFSTDSRLDFSIIERPAIGPLPRPVRRVSHRPFRLRDRPRPASSLWRAP